MKNFTPFHHQQEVHDFILANNGIGFLAWEVGCGKTPATLHIFSSLRKRDPNLRMIVICPVSLINKAWGDQIQIWTDFNYYDCRNDKAHYQDRSKPVDIFVINYESLISKKHQQRLSALLNKHDFLGVLDEAHKIKDHRSQRAKMLNGFWKGRRWTPGLRELMKYRMCLTGTPDPNSRIEWFSQCQFISNEVFGMKFSAFRSYYFYLERTGWNGERQTAEIQGDILPLVSKGFKINLIPQRRDEFYACLSRYVHFAKKKDCLDLPDEIDEVRSVEMDAKQKRFYDEMNRNLVIELSEDAEVTAAIALTKIMKLNQISNGFVMNDQKEVVQCGNKKLKELESTLEEVGNQQVIIWGHFIHEIDSILDMLKEKSCALYGKTKNRDQVISDFLDGKYQYLVANPASAAEGLTLVNCSVQVFASLNYSLLEYEQCRGRTHRPGQKNKCTYIHLLTSGTIEEEIYLILKGKKTAQELAYEFINRGKHTARNNRRGVPAV